MTTDRITEVRIKGMRVLDDVKLDLRGVSALIGENGTGKSTLLEAFEILRRAAEPGNFISALMEGHGPIQDLVRSGSDSISLGVTVEGEAPRVEYSFVVALVGNGCSVREEELVIDRDGERFTVIGRTEQGVLFRDPQLGSSDVIKPYSSASLVAAAAGSDLNRMPTASRLVQALRGIEVHPPFDVRPSWQQYELQTRRGPRWPSPPAALTRVKRYGEDLPAAFGILRNDKEKWERLIDRARFAVGGALQDIQLVPVGASQLEIMLKFDRNPRPLPLRVLSEGQLSFLIMLAVVELHDGRTLLALDEPDPHFHPELIVNFVQVIEEVARAHPVVIATHSDRLLDALQDPEGSVVLCELDDDSSATLRRPMPGSLAPWLERYRGLGAVRAAGYAHRLFDGGDKPAGGGEEPS